MNRNALEVVINFHSYRNMPISNKDSFCFVLLLKLLIILSTQNYLHVGLLIYLYKQTKQSLKLNKNTHSLKLVETVCGQTDGRSGGWLVVQEWTAVQTYGWKD